MIHKIENITLHVKNLIRKLMNDYFSIVDPAIQYNSRTCKIQTLYVSFRDLQWQVIAQYYFISFPPRIFSSCLLSPLVISITERLMERSKNTTRGITMNINYVFFVFVHSGLDHCAWRLRRLLLQRWMQFSVKRTHECNESRDCSDSGASRESWQGTQTLLRAHQTLTDLRTIFSRRKQRYT